MSAIDLIVGQLQRNLDWLEMTLSDFSEQDMLARPTPAANHPLWQLGHLAASETEMMEMIRPGSMPKLPEGFAQRFDNKNTNVDDPKQLAGKQELLELMARVRQGTIALARSLKPEDLEKPAPEAARGYAATVGDLLLMGALHVAMHMGQMQVARRKLGKKVLF